MRPEEDDLASDDLVETQLGEITTPTPDATRPWISPNGDVHEVVHDQNRIGNRLPLDDIDALLVAYILDLKDSQVQEPGPDDSRRSQVQHDEVRRPERVPRR